MWQKQIAKQVRLGVLLFVFLVYLGIAGQRTLLEGTAIADFSLALGCVALAVTPVFLTMGYLLNGPTEEH